MFNGWVRSCIDRAVRQSFIPVVVIVEMNVIVLS